MRRLPRRHDVTAAAAAALASLARGWIHAVRAFEFRARARACLRSGLDSRPLNSVRLLRGANRALAVRALEFRARNCTEFTLSGPLNSVRIQGVGFTSGPLNSAHLPRGANRGLGADSTALGANPKAVGANSVRIEKLSAPIRRGFKSLRCEFGANSKLSVRTALRSLVAIGAAPSPPARVE